MQANESGGRLDPNDPLTKPYLAKAEKDRKKRKEPNRIPYKLADMLSLTARYGPMLERLEDAPEKANPYAGVPESVVAEIRAALEARQLPSWFSATVNFEALENVLKVLTPP